MSKNLELASEDITEVFTEIIQSHDLDAFAQFRIFETKQKEFLKIARANKAVEFFSKTQDCVLAYVDRRIWDRLEDKQRRLLIENALAGLSYDDEKGKMNLEQPDLAISSGCYALFGKDLVDAAEIASHALRQIKEEEKAAKEAKKAEKAGKGKKWTPDQD